MLPKIGIIIDFMAEKLIYLEGVDPVDFYGVNNIRFQKLSEKFSDLKLVQRGNEIKASGTAARLEEFEEKVDLLLRYLKKFSALNLSDLDELLENRGEGKMDAPGQDEGLLLHGERG